MSAAVPVSEGNGGVAAQNPLPSGELPSTTSLAQQPLSPVGTSPPSNALVTAPGTAGTSQNAMPVNTVDQTNRYNNNNEYANSYNTGMGYGGLGMGYGGLGMGYGGLGMGYGGLGMPGMYGGLGMGGLYGGLGMPGMYGMGMSEDFQRSQMTFMLVGRLLEMCGMFAGVIQMTFGSALQFMGNYIGMSQQYNKLKSGMYMDEAGRWVELPKGTDSSRESAVSGTRRRPSRHRKQEKQSHPIFGVLRRLLFLLLAVMLAKRLTR